MQSGADAVEQGRRRFEATATAIDDVPRQIAETHGHVVQIDAAPKEQYRSLGQLDAILAELGRLSAQAAAIAGRQLEKSTLMEALLAPT